MEDGPGLNTGVIVGILILVCVVLLLIVDATCCFLNKCGILMCLCGKPGQSSKSKDIETGKAAFVQDASKEPIVEVRAEEEVTANHDAEGHSEPNETTPLTILEKGRESASAVVDMPLSMATNSDTVTDTFELSQCSPVSESTTLTSSITAATSDPANPTHVTSPDNSTPKPSVSSSNPGNVTLLVDLNDSPEARPDCPPSEEPLQAPPSSPDVQSGALSSSGTEKELHESVEISSNVALNGISPQGSLAVPLLNHEFEIDGEQRGDPDVGVPHDGSHSGGSGDSSDLSAAEQDEKIVENESVPSENTELKKVALGAGVEANTIIQTNNIESKA
ncbi:hypothetical protein DNTS_003677 [Danionella cerebrum]|uniref:Uncharacterized protein n=1 Tax=Danionella cerebrum TaxID=2873325 RepID=A0A553QKT6_9TELE|nr:hypothetical protein DNTS_003677 [Danionella translucida]